MERIARENSDLCTFRKLDEAEMAAQGMELLLAVEEEFVVEIPDDVAEKLVTVSQVAAFISEHPQAR